MGILGSIKKRLFRYKVVDCCDNSVKAMGLYFTSATVQFKDEEIQREVLLIRWWDAYNKYCIPLNDKRKRDLKVFFQEAKSASETQITLPVVHGGPFIKKLSFKVTNNKKRKVIIHLGYLPSTSSLSDEQLKDVHNYFTKYIFIGEDCVKD
jgi:hypothetical protein